MTLDTLIPRLVSLALGLALAPLLQGIVTRTKAVFAGRRGAPLLQPYFDLAKLLRKGAVYSRTTTPVFRAGAIAALALPPLLLALVPFAGAPALISFPGDFLLLAGLFALLRVTLVLAALDTGSAFEGMGASREVYYSALVEPTLLLALATLARRADSFSMSGFLPAASPFSAELLLACAALMIVFLCENSRIPFDDPNTHLELTMIHEVLILDHGGPDLAFLLYGAYLKFWILGTLVVSAVLPALAGVAAPLRIALWLAALALLAVVVGCIESSIARLRLIHTPRLLAVAGSLAALAFLLTLR
jgi:formate hydrogenlyase subunit 4